MDVAVHKNAAGDVILGVQIEGDFVPFVTLSAGKVSQLRERHGTLVERADAGDDQAREVLGSAYSPKSDEPEPEKDAETTTEPGEEAGY